MKIQSPRRTKKFASALLTVGVVGGSLVAPAATVGAQASTDCGPAPAGYNVIDSNAATINGTSGNDFICAGTGDNTINGLGGDDIIFGRSGADRIMGGEGNDVIHGNSGKDRIFGGAGNDVLNGNNGRDRIFGGAGNDVLKGNKERDQLFGGLGNDDLSGGGGEDRLRGGNGEDVLEGNLGDDELLGDGNADVLRGNRGNDILDGGNGLNIAIGGPDSDVCFNAADDDTVCEILDGVEIANPTQTILATFENGTDGGATIAGRNWNVAFNGEENVTVTIPGVGTANPTISNGRWAVNVPNSAALFGRDITATNTSTTQVLETALDSFSYNANTQNLTVTGTPDATIRVLVNDADGDLIFLEQITFGANGNGSTNLSEVDDLDSIDISRQDSDGDIEFYRNVHQ